MIRNRQQKQDRQRAEKGRILARPTQPKEAAPLGLQQPLGLGVKRDGFLYVPASYQVNQPAPLVLMLHGAGGNAHQALALFQHLADAFGLILLAPDSRDQTWDIILGGYGSDIAFIDSALEQTFNRYAIDSTRIAIEGFSDGASYALGVGITNGDLFTHAIAFSPGFMAPVAQRGEPRLFISHGKWDNVLPIDRCSRKIVPQVQQAGYDVVYQEFNGSHVVPDPIARAAVTWFTA
ncbi:MAG TPA: phospholipase [Cyanobacteria bacterium UBA11049]|nr:phospholipase [Cyanobacteria bacterium UBA11049]